VRRVGALVAAELLALVRDRWTFAGLLGMLLVVGALGPGSVALREQLRAELDPAPGPRPRTAACRPSADAPPDDRLPRVAVVGPAPDWLAWPDPLVDVGHADVLLRVSGEAPVLIEVVPLAGAPADPKAGSGPTATHGASEQTGGAPRGSVTAAQAARQVRDCLRARVRDERRARLTALGISEDPSDVVRVNADPHAPADGGDAPASRPLGISLIAGLALLVSSVFLELGPRARASGWLEAWLALPGPRWHLVGAWWLVGAVVGAAGSGMVVAGDAIGAALAGTAPGGVAPALLPVLVLVTSAVGVRAFVDVPDIRAAMAHAIPVVVLLAASVGAAAAAEEVAGVGGLVPLGGLALAVADGRGNAGLAACSAVAAAGLLLWDAARRLDGLVVREGATVRTAARRARGDYRAEVALLVAIAVAGASGWAPPGLTMADPVARTVLAMTLFVALPALAAPIALGLERASLLSLRAAPLRAWLLLPLVVAGTLSLGGHLWEFGDRSLPSPLNRVYADAVGEFDGAAGLLALSLVPGLCEELLFRGAILGLLRRRTPAWAAVLAQAIAFALLHALGARLPYTFALGLVLGTLVARSGSLAPAIVAHTAHNLLAASVPQAWLAGWLAHPASWIVAGAGCVAAYLSTSRK
jgi:membrane protease YdiL (CAAX protease family)